MKHEPVIYRIVNVVNGKFYLGSTVNLPNRKKVHLAALRRGRHHSAILQRAYNKHGEAAFVFEVIEPVLDEQELLRREQHFLDTLKPPYNVSLQTGERTRLGMKSSPEHVARMSASLKGRAGTNKGKQFSAEHRRRISESLRGNKNCLGRTQTAETRAKISAHHNPASNAVRSLETKAKTSASCKRWHAALTDEEKSEWRRKLSAGWKKKSLSERRQAVPADLPGRAGR